MKNKEVFGLREALNEVDYIRGKSFAYAVFKNKDLLDKEIEIINKLKKQPHPEYINFDNERTLLCQLHCEKDENQEPVYQYNPDGTQSFKIANIEGFNTEYVELSAKYQDVIDDMQKTKLDFDDFLNKDSEVILNKVNIDDLPEDVSASFLEKIKFMID